MDDLGFLKVAAVVPEVHPGAVKVNADILIQTFLSACDAGAELVVFPEMSLTAYTCADLFFQSQLLQTAEEEACRVIEETSARSAILVFGMPLALGGRLFNVAVLVRGGQEILGIVPKTCIPNYREYYENRWFASADEATFSEATLAGQKVPFGTDLIFQHNLNPSFTFAVEICEDLWSPIPPSSRTALAGAGLLINLSASNELVGKAEYRENLVLQQSARCLAGYVYVSAGPGESTTDTVFGGHALVAENGRLLASSKLFPKKSEITLAEIDMELIQHERRISRIFGTTARRELAGKSFRTVGFSGKFPPRRQVVYRYQNPHPFVPPTKEEKALRCQKILSIQSTALATRLERAKYHKVVLGLSGGLDSSLALMVAIKAFERLELPRQGIEALTMPGFGTTSRTLENVKKLCAALEIPLKIIDIREGCKVQLQDLDHSGKSKDTAYENIQARYRTSLLMNRANMIGGLVVGTGDLSELALGWCTYNGDHMSMYNVNSGVPKTLVRYLLAHAAETLEPETIRTTLIDILDTPISPELLPPEEGGGIQQKTENIIGPYELHDFFLYHAIRHGSRPKKVLALAVRAFPKEYKPQDIKKWLRLFYQRFFSQQFKRSCLPDGPKIGTLALSPRADWRMPSDASVQEWLRDLKEDQSFQ